MPVQNEHHVSRVATRRVGQCIHLGGSWFGLPNADRRLASNWLRRTDVDLSAVSGPDADHN
jgi:hypothetical protein